MLGVILGLGCAVGFAFSDFFGGLSSRLSNAKFTMLVSRAGSLPVFALLLLVVPSTDVATSDVIRGVIAGCCVTAALLLLYDVLSRGAMGVSIALTGLASAIIPLSWALTRGESLSAVGIVGVVLGLVSVFVVNQSGTRVTESNSRKWDPLQAAVAGAFFGLDFVMIGGSGPESGVVPLFVSETVVTVAAVAVFLVSRSRHALTVKVIGTAFSAGMFAAVAAAMFLWAAREGAASTAAVLQATAPAFVAVIAFAVLRQRLGRRQIFGIFLAVFGTCLLAI